MNTKACEPPGWYGKMASLGDFASRRLPADFITIWDRWLQEVISLSRSDLGDAWLDAYLTCPVWRFLLQAGACGEKIWAGVLMPSVDKVGRYFPLSVVVELPGLPATEPALRALCEWIEQMEILALSTLNKAYSPQRFDAEILATPLPWEPVIPSQIALAERLLAKLRSGDAALYELPSSDALPRALADVASLLVAETSHGASLWWAQHPPGSEAPLLVCRGLPDAHYFAAMLGAVPPHSV